MNVVKHRLNKNLRNFKRTFHRWPSGLLDCPDPRCPRYTRQSPSNPNLGSGQTQAFTRQKHCCNTAFAFDNYLTRLRQIPNALGCPRLELRLSRLPPRSQHEVDCTLACMAAMLMLPLDHTIRSPPVKVLISLRIIYELSGSK